MVIMSEWVYGNGKRQRRGEECVFSQIQPQLGRHCQQLEHAPLQVDNMCSINFLCSLHIVNGEKCVL